MAHLLPHEPPGAAGIEAVDRPLLIAIGVTGRAAARGHEGGRDEQRREERGSSERGRDARKRATDHARKCVGSGGYQAQPRFDREQTDIRPAAAADEHLVAVGSAF